MKWDITIETKVFKRMLRETTNNFMLINFTT